MAKNHLLNAAELGLTTFTESSDVKAEKLHEAFDIVCTHEANVVTVATLGAFLVMNGDSVTAAECNEIMQQLAGGDTLSFFRFAELMTGVDTSAMAPHEVAVRFVDEAKKASPALRAKDPLWKKMVVDDGAHPYVKQLAEILEGPIMQGISLVLIVIGAARAGRRRCHTSSYAHAAHVSKWAY